MKCAALEIILDEEIVLSARNTTTGNHECLDYIPGSALLGAVASTLYARLPREQAFQIFHTGKVRFGDGLPLTSDGEPFSSGTPRRAGHDRKPHATSNPHRAEGTTASR